MKISFRSSVLTALVFLLLFPLEAFASEKFYYKGANYSSITVEEEPDRRSDMGSSAVVATAAATFDGGGGKVRVRGWTRDAIVKNYYGAKWIYVNKMDFGLTHPRLEVTSLIGTMSPNASNFNTNLPGLHWLVEVFNVLYAVTKSSSSYIEHKRDSYNKIGEVHFKNLGAGTSYELPSNIKYNDAESTLNNSNLNQSIPSGLSAFFEYKYNPGKNPGELRAWSKAYYTYGKEVAPGVNVVIGVRTGNATVDFLINQK